MFNIFESSSPISSAKFETDVAYPLLKFSSLMVKTPIISDLKYVILVNPATETNSSLKIHRNI